jgi:hypothetical protein
MTDLFRQEEFKIYQEILKLYEKLKIKINIISTDNCFNDEYFIKHELKYKELLELTLLSGPGRNSQLVISLFNIRKKMLNRLLDNISDDNIGTCINIARELCNDLYIDIIRTELV